MKADHTRSLRLQELRRLAIALHAQGASPDRIILALKTRIVKMGVSQSTARNYLDTVVGQLSQ